MPIQLDKILADIAKEKVLHPNYPNVNKKELDNAWERVGKKNKLSVHEARSIFKVLQKKYEQEKAKGTSTWKLFGVMEEIHRKEELQVNLKQESENEGPMEEDEEYEMLEVQEDEENAQQHASSSEADSPTKPIKSSNSTPEKEEKPLIRTKAFATRNASTPNNATQSDEKKVLNSLAPNTRAAAQAAAPQTPQATAAALHKKGITMKKTTLNTPTALANKTAASSNNNSPQLKQTTARVGGNIIESGKTIQLPESIKRKLSEEQAHNTHIKKINLGQAITSALSATSAQQSAKANNLPTTTTQIPHTTTAQLMQAKHERDDQIAQSNAATSNATHGINLITIPANPTRADLANGIVGGGATSSTAATVASTSTNGFSPRIEDIDFRNDIIFDSGINGGSAVTHKQHNANASEIINLGNFDNSLPPTFFKNLCNSSRHEALGLYVANVMNRLQPRSAAKLELGILRAIIDVQSDDLEQ